MKKRELLERIEALENAVFTKFDSEEKQNDLFEKKSPDPTEQTRPEIIPAEPLRIVPEEGQSIWFVCVQTHDQTAYPVKGNWDKNHYQHFVYFQAGLVFPDTPEGKAGAELRAREGIVPYPVQPAKALTEPLEVGEEYWLCSDDGSLNKFSWDGGRIDLRHLPQGRIFPHNLRGKLGAAMFQEGGQDA